MSIYTDIQKITKIPETNETALFIRRKEDGRSQKTKKHKSPKNVKLYDYDEDNNNEECNDLSQEYHLHETEIACSVREANGGISYSNENFEVLWKSKQMEFRNSDSNVLEKDLSSVKSLYEDDNSTKEIDNEILSDNNNKSYCIEDEESILKMCRLDKNAVIRGLLRNRIISLKDLCASNNCIDLKHKSSTNVQHEDDFPLSNLNEKYSMKLVPCPEDPEVFVQPLQAYGSIDENEYKDIDFTVPHVGKKTIVTSRQFFINMDDSDFDFVKKDSQIKK
ncbi:hypothetical protein ANTRET_LOCUS242 [Anthophora retusa]